MRLRQVLINLVGNAVKFTPSGEVSVIVEPEAITESTARLKFTIRDTGIGIAPERQQFIFGAFMQADSSTTRQYGGSGLGLAISSQLVRLMGGDVQVESELNTGSRFFFSLAFERSVANATEITAPQLPAELDEMRVLVVDDNSTNRHILTRTLTRWGMRVTEADSGAQALAILQEAVSGGDPYELILLDVFMPNMDGFSALEQIRRDPELDRPAILMLSSIDRRADIARARELGAAAYLVKPVLCGELRLAILRAISAGHPTPGQRPAPIPYSTRRERPTRRRLRVLVAEDNDVNQLYIVRLLEKAGHEVTVAANGEEALRLLQKDAYDLVLMDVQMPKLDGYQAAARIRELEKGTDRHLPIIAMTAHAMKGDRELCLQAGMDHYVAKPIKTQLLFQAIESVLDRSDSAARRNSESGEPRDHEGQSPESNLPMADLEFHRELAAMFLEDCPQLISNIREAIDHRDASELKMAAHTLKGSVGVFKDHGAFDSVFRMEHIGSDADWDQVEDAWIVLSHELQCLSETLEGGLVEKGV